MAAATKGKEEGDIRQISKTKRRKSMAESEWSDLPSDLLSLVRDRLELPDLLRFRSVCRQWRSLTSPSAGKKSLWAIFPERVSSFYKPPPVTPPPPTPAKFFSLSEDRSYQIPLGPDRHCIGSGFGWLVMVANPADVSSSAIEIYLCNPITGSQIPLPPFTHLTRFNFFRYGYRTVKCILSSSPTEDDCIVFLLKGIHESDESNGSLLAYARPAGKGWETIKVHRIYFADVALHRGQIYMVSYHGDIFSWDFCKRILPERVIVAQPLDIALEHWKIGNNLVSTPWGDLLNVIGISPWRPVSVMKMDFEKRMLTQVEGDYLGEHVIVLGRHTSLCLSALDFPHLKKNCIYFMGLGIYSLKDGALKPLEPVTYPPPICFIPTSEISKE